MKLNKKSEVGSVGRDKIIKWILMLAVLVAVALLIKQYGEGMSTILLKIFR